MSEMSETEISEFINKILNLNKDKVENKKPYVCRSCGGNVFINIFEMETYENQSIPIANPTSVEQICFNCMLPVRLLDNIVEEFKKLIQERKEKPIQEETSI